MASGRLLPIKPIFFFSGGMLFAISAANSSSFPVYSGWIRQHGCYLIPSAILSGRARKTDCCSVLISVLQVFSYLQQSGQRPYRAASYLQQANKTSNILLGKNKRDILTAKCFALFHGKNSPPQDCPGRKCLKSGEPVTFELFESHLNKFLEIKAFPRFSKNKDRLVGQPAKRQAVTNPENTVFSIKRFMGRRHDEVKVEEKLVPYSMDKVTLTT